MGDGKVAVLNSTRTTGQSTEIHFLVSIAVFLKKFLGLARFVCVCASPSSLAISLSLFLSIFLSFSRSTLVRLSPHVFSPHPSFCTPTKPYLALPLSFIPFLSLPLSVDHSPSSASFSLSRTLLLLYLRLISYTAHSPLLSSPSSHLSKHPYSSLT